MECFEGKSAEGRYNLGPYTPGHEWAGRVTEAGFRPDFPGGFGEYMILEEAYTHVIPEDWSDEIGIFVENFSVGYWGNGCNPDVSDDCAYCPERIETY